MRLSTRHYRELLARYLGPQRGRVIVLAVLLLSSIGLQLVNPQILRYFIDAASAGGAARSLLGAAALFIVVALAAQGVAVAATYVGEKVGWLATNRLREDLTLHCLELDMPFHNTRTPGELIERIDGDITAMASFFSQFVIRVIGNVLLLAGVVVLMLLEDWRAGLALLIFSCFALAVLVRMRGIAVTHWTAAREASADLFGFLEERLAGIDDIRANGGGTYFIRRFYERSRVLMRKMLAAGTLGSGFWVIISALFMLGHALTLSLGAYLFARGAITIGTVYLFFQYTEMLRRPLQQITEQLREFQRAMAGVGRVHELFSVQRAILDGPGTALPPGALAVEFDEVSFGYGDAGLVLDDLRFRLEPGQVLGLLGRTGSGKTTLTRLLFRLYEPSTGTIRLSGVDLRAPRLADLRHAVGIVTQDVQLLQASVRDNLTFFDPTIQDEQIVAVLDDLGMGRWLASLPDGLETELSPGGAGLSAGEAQLLALTRVFLRNPGLVIMDEASSRLDPATEQLIERAIDKLLCPAGTRRTGIIIAHRLGTVQRADEIMILENGRIREHGAREQLVRDPDSRFYQLLQTGLEEVLA